MKDTENEFIKQLHLLNIYKRYIVDRRLEERGIYFGQPPILRVLSERPNATQRQIAEELHISPASIAVSVKRMEKSGMISRQTDVADARRNNLSLTEKGKELNSFAKNTFDSVDEAMLSGFSEEELEYMLKIIKRMNYNVLSVMPENGRRSFKEKEEKNA